MQNKLNDLSGKEWLYSTNSIDNISFNEQDLALYSFLNIMFQTRFTTSGNESYAHKIRKVHPSPKPPQLMANLINFFTKKDQLVFDPFCGVGGTLLGCSLTNRKAIGVDLNPTYKDVYDEASTFLDLEKQLFHTGEARNLLENGLLNDIELDLILTDPPYGNMMSKLKTGDAINKKKSNLATPFSNSELDLGNLERDEFLSELKSIIEISSRHLKDKKYIIVFIKDLQPKKDYHGMLHYDIMNAINDIDNVYYKGLKIWYDKSINLFPYGYPYAYVSNQLHQYILIFRKEIKK
jgi:tRNA G10  N-methylase Trm11